MGRAWFLPLMIMGCRPSSSPPPSSPAEPPPAEVAADPKPTPIAMAPVRTLAHYPAARFVLESFALSRRVEGRELEAPPTAEAFVAELSAIAEQDIAIAIAAGQILDGANWQAVFGPEADIAAEGTADAIARAHQSRPGPVDPGELRMISSPLAPHGFGNAGFNAVGALVGGRLVTVAATAVGVLAGFTLSDDLRHALVVHEVGSGYGGAIVPGSFGGVTLTSVSLDNLTSSTVTIDCEEHIDSAAFIEFEGNRVRVRLRDSWGIEDRHAWLDCDLSQADCRRTEVDVLLPVPPYLEVTALTAYDVEPLPAGFNGPEGLLRRTVHVSPNGAQTSFVTQSLVKLRPDPDWSRTLWIAQADGSNARKVAEGWGWFHAQWQADGTLLYEPDPLPSEAMRIRLQNAAEEDAAGDDEWIPTEHQQQRLDLMRLHFELDREPAWQALEYELIRHEPGSNERVPVPSPYPTRLWSSFRQPKIVGSGPTYVEVPFEVDQPKAFDPKCTARRVGHWTPVREHPS